MKRIEINTQKNENGYTNNSGYTFSENSNSTINNGVPFPVISGSTNLDYQVTSTCSKNNSINYHVTKNENKYSICIDWLEFICIKDDSIELAFINNQNPNIIIEKISVHHNPNFLNLHKIYFGGVEAFEIYSKPNNSKHRKNEVSISVANHLLYTKGYYSMIHELIKSFGLKFIRIARMDIALDGVDILKLIDILIKYSKSHTIQTNNDAIKILPTAFNKKELRWLSWSIGSNNSGISAIVYNKTDEIEVSSKNFIADYWNKNDLSTEDIGRFEVQLMYKRLKKYNFNLTDIEQLMNAKFIGAILTNEVKPWLKFFRVKKKDMMNHKKEVAIKKGREIKYIKWDKLPANMELLKTIDYVSNSSAVNARNTISFNLHEILLNPATSTKAQVEVIRKYAVDYSLQDFVKKKIASLNHYNDNEAFKDFMKNLDVF